MSESKIIISDTHETRTIPKADTQDLDFISTSRTKRTVFQRLYTIGLILFITCILVTDICIQFIIGVKRFHKLPKSVFLFIPLGFFIFCSFWKSVMARARGIRDPGLEVARQFYNNMIRNKLFKTSKEAQREKIMHKASLTESNEEQLISEIVSETKIFTRQKNELRNILDTKHRGMFSRNKQPAYNFMWIVKGQHQERIS